MISKRVTRRAFLRTAVIGSAAGMLAACAAPAAPAAPKPAEEAKPTEAPAAGASLQGKQGTLWGLKYDPHVDAYKRLSAMFEKKTGAVLKVEPQDWPIETKVITALSAGTPPDAICIMGKVLPPLHMQKALLPCSDLVYKPLGMDPYKNFYDDAAGAYTWGSEIYGVPVEVNQAGSMVNVLVDEVIEAKLGDKFAPTNGKKFFDSYESLYELSKELQKKEGDKVSRWGLSSQGWESTSLLGIMRSLGTDWWDVNNKKFNANSEAGVKALEYLVEKPVKMGIETQLDQNGIDAAMQGKVAIVRGNGSPTVQGKDLGYHYEMTGAPMVNGKDPLFIGEAGWGFAAPVATKNQDISVAFLQMMATPEGQMEYSKIYGGIISSTRSLAGKFDWFKDSSPENQNVKAGKVMLEALVPNTIYYGDQFGYASEVDKACAEVCAQVRQGKATAAEGAKLLQERFENQYKQYTDDVKKLGG